MEYSVAICSHNRIQTLKKKTLRVLTLYGIPTEKIHIFVAPEEVADYRAAFLGYTVVEGAMGLAQNRNAVVNYFPEGSLVLFLDDDLRGFLEYTTDNQRKERQLENFHDVVCRGFRECWDRGLSLWGLYPVANGRWMKPTITTGLVFCYGCCFGLFIRKDVQSTMHFKEDYERTLRFYKRDGAVLRMNWVAPLQSFCKGKGGLNEVRTLDRELADCRALFAEFPTWMTFGLDKGKWQIRLKKNPQTTQDEQGELL